MRKDVKFKRPQNYQDENGEKKSENTRKSESTDKEMGSISEVECFLKAKIFVECRRE